MKPELGLEVAHAVLYVHDVEQMVAFYCDTLGFEVTDRGPLRDAEIVEWTRNHFETEPEFGPMEEFFERRAEHLR